MNLAERWHTHLGKLRASQRHRVLTPPIGIDFSSNDYLGYSKRVWPVAQFSRSGAASRLLRGQHPIWDEVETQLAGWHQAEAALLMTSGYAANEGLLSTVIDAGDTVFSDQCNHASIIDGLRLGRAERVIFPHCDLNVLELQMRRQAPSRRETQAWFVVTESLFGMEGDQAPLRQLAELADRYQAQLIVDEAHATGCFGAMGSGLVDALNLRDRVLATVHTGGKALGVPGAYVVGSRLLKDLLVNRCRHFIYTTALPPQIGAWWLDVLAIRADDAVREALRERVHAFHAAMAELRVGIRGADYIASIVLGADTAAVNAASKLQQAGFDVRAIRPPTVPDGTARLRISIHADHELGKIHELARAIGDLAQS